jgi:ACS family hexuronate transporter-like MFS transporter
LYITWLPVYLYNVRGFKLQEIGMFGWLPYVSADAGSLLGGYVSGRLIARGWSIDRARKTVIAAAAVFMLAGIPAAIAADRMVALACIACVTFGFQAWINNVQTIPSDVFPANAVASVAGLGGVGAGVGAIVFTMTTGYVVDHYSYTPILLTAAVLPIVGTMVLFVVGGTIQAVRHEN